MSLFRLFCTKILILHPVFKEKKNHCSIFDKFLSIPLDWKKGSGKMEHRKPIVWALSNHAGFLLKLPLPKLTQFPYPHMWMQESIPMCLCILTAGTLSPASLLSEYIDRCRSLLVALLIELKLSSSPVCKKSFDRSDQPYSSHTWIEIQFWSMNGQHSY